MVKHFITIQQPYIKKTIMTDMDYIKSFLQDNLKTSETVTLPLLLKINLKVLPEFSHKQKNLTGFMKF